MNLAIASPSASTYSETFIRLQWERLPCCLRIHGGPVAGETIPGGPTIRLRSVRGVLESGYDFIVLGRRWEGPQSRELKRRLRRAGIDVLLANFGPTGSGLLPVCRELGIPLVVHFHGYDAHLESLVDQHRDDYRRLGAEAAAIVAVSCVMEDALSSCGIPREKIHVIRCGCDEELFVPKTDFSHAPLFFGVGRFVDKKAPHLTVLAFKGVHDVIPSARLILAGTGPLLESTRNLSLALGLGAVVDFPGVLAPAEVALQMRNATAFVQHSITPELGENRGDREGTPVAVLEAMMCGVPVVATRHAGIGEVIEHEKTGLLVPERDVVQMTSCMLRLAQSSEFAQLIGKAARKAAQSTATAGEYISRLRGVLERNASQPR